MRQVPLDGNAERSEAVRRLKKRLRRNEIVAIAMNQEDRRTRPDLACDPLDRCFGRCRQQPGISDDGERGSRAAQSHMQRHHGALAKPDQGQRRGWKVAALELRIEKAVDHRSGFEAAQPALVGVAESERKPLPADWCLTARLRRMRRYEGCLRQEALPGASNIDEVVAIGAVTV